MLDAHWALRLAHSLEGRRPLAVLAASAAAAAAAAVVDVDAGGDDGVGVDVALAAQADAFVEGSLKTCQ